ncbi:MAG: type II secretion system major pseudopilin GspG [Phycisphaerae bacterium]|jgi:general secretion pathway protein G
MESKTKKQRNAFTIIEVMAVLIILGLLATVVAVNVVGHVKESRVRATKLNLKKLHQAVQSFEMQTNRYPDENVGLIELIEQPSDVENWPQGGFLETTEIPTDAWGNEFVFELDPASGKPFVIISYGADDEEGGEGDDADLYSTDAK